MTAQVQTRPIDQRRLSPLDSATARSLVGLPELPTVVAVGPFDDPAHTDRLAAAFAAVQLRCKAQLVFLGADVQAVADHRWQDLIAAADVVAPSTTTGSMTVLDVMAVGRPLIAPANPATVQLVVSASAGLVYRQGDVSGMAAAFLRLLTAPALRYGMGCRAREVAQRQQSQHLVMYRDKGNEYV
jgi:glycosyltransferase involved in cell wall biosynthesis